MISINLESIAILNILGVHYRCIIIGSSKSEAINLLKKNADLITIGISKSEAINLFKKMLIRAKKVGYYKI